MATDKVKLTVERTIKYTYVQYGYEEQSLAGDLPALLKPHGVNMYYDPLFDPEDEDQAFIITTEKLKKAEVEVISRHRRPHEWADKDAGEW